jgi:ribosomal protein L4
MTAAATPAPQAAPELSAADRVRALIDLTESLAHIFEKENLALAKSRPEEMEPLQAEKARLAAAYAQSVRAVAADRMGVSSVGSELLVRLRAATEGFEARAARQKGLLERAGA